MAVAENNPAPVVQSPKKCAFRAEHNLVSQNTLETRLIILTIHQRGDFSYGNAWINSPQGTQRLISEMRFAGPAKEIFLAEVMENLRVVILSKFANLAETLSVMFVSVSFQIAQLIEARAEIIFCSDLPPLERARKIYDIIIEEGMEAKYLWVQRIHELVFEAEVLSLYDVGLCEARLFHEQSKSTLGRKYL